MKQEPNKVHPPPHLQESWRQFNAEVSQHYKKLLAQSKEQKAA